MKIEGGLLIIGAALSVLMAACATPSPPSAMPCGPPKTYQGSPAWEDIVKDAQQIKSLSARVELTLGEGSPAKLRGLLVYRAPHWLRFEALSPWGQPSAYLIINAQQLSYFTFGDNRLILGAADGPAIKEILGLELPSSWFLSLLNGRGWLAQGDSPFLKVEETGVGKKFKLYYTALALQEEILWDGTTGEIREIRFSNQNNKMEVKAQLEGTLCSQGISFPQSIRLNSPPGWKAQMTFAQLEINNPLEDSLFEIPGPQEGMKIYYIK